MSDPEPVEQFRARLLRVVDEELRPFVRIASDPELDVMGRQHNRFRTGVPLKGFDGSKDDYTEESGSEQKPW